METDDTLAFCRVDGATLVRDSSPPPDEASALSEIETSILPHTTDSNITRSTGPTTALPDSLMSDTTRKLPRPKRKLIAVAVVVLVAMCVSVAGYLLYARRTSSTIQSIAVMPFTNDSGDTDVDYLSDGMTETLINSLSNIPNLSVKARSSVFRYKGKNLDPKKIAAELNVQAILIGRVIERGEQVSLSLELIDAATENVIWGNKYERKSSDLVTLQSDVARDVSNKLKSRLDAEEGKIAKGHTADPEAYQLYLKGLFYWNKRTPEALKKSVEYFNLALDKDPNYALAYAGIASSYVLFPEYSIYAPREVVPKAKTMARRALELDDNLAEAHTAFGYALLTYDRNFDEANKHFKRAMELNPSYATAYQWYTDGYLVASGKVDEALAQITKAHDLDPLSLIINTQMGLCYVYARDYDKAHEQFRKTIELDPNWYLGHWFLGLTHELKGNLTEAYAEYQKADELGDDPYILAHLAHVQAALGRREDALKNIEEMKQIAKHRYVPAYAFAIAYVGLGEKDEALNWLERSDEDRAWDILHVKVEPFLDPLRNEPRYKKLIERLGF